MKIYVKDKELRRLILKSGHSVSSFADSVEVTRSFMSNIVNRRSTLSPALAQRIAGELGLEFDNLFFVGTKEEFEQIK